MQTYHESFDEVYKKARFARLFIIKIVFLVLLGIYWSPMPKLFWVNEYVDDQRTVVGYSTTDTLIRVAETLLDKRGGYLSNDVMPPGVWLDNMPNWEYGVLTQVRDLARVTRNDYSRSQSQSAEGRTVPATRSGVLPPGSPPAASGMHCRNG